MSPSVASRLRKSTIVRVEMGTLWLLRRLLAVAARWTPELAARWAAVLFLTPPRHEPPERERRWLASARRLTVESGGLRLAAWSWGEGPPVLLVHGWGGRGGQLGALAAPLVEAGLRVVTFDAPGHGESGGRRSSLPEMASAVRAMVEHLGPLAGLVAHSAGAGATSYALASGLPVERVVYVAPGLDPTHFTELFGRHLGLGPEVLERMGRRIEARVGVGLSELRASTHAPAMGAPLLVFHDRFDEETPCWHSRELVRAWPRAQLTVTAGLGHRRILRDPEVIEGAVAFLAGERAQLREVGRVAAAGGRS